jgi:hypothetical protein
MADAGAVSILRLLDTPSEALGTAVGDLSETLAAAEGQEGVVPSAAYVTIDELRGLYRSLGQQIEAIGTGAGAKADVLAALTRMDAGLVNLAAGLRKGVSEGAVGDLENAKRRIGRAGADLVRAQKKL